MTPISRIETTYKSRASDRSLRAAQESLNRDYRDLQTKKSAMLKEMKGTREQRIKRLGRFKTNLCLVTISCKIQVDQAVWGGDGEDATSYGKGKGQTYVFHKYEDGQVDQPFLTPDTVKD